MKKTCTRCKKSKKLKKFLKHRAVCRECLRIECTKKRRTLIGKVGGIYDNQVRNSKRRKHAVPNYTKQELVTWCLGQRLYYELHKAWEQSEYKSNLAPSCDRINDYKPYTLDNIQLMTWAENNKKATNDTKSGKLNKRSVHVIQLALDNKVVATYNSTHEAHRKTGINQGNIVQCCRGSSRYKHAGNYKWRYNEE